VKNTPNKPVDNDETPALTLYILRKSATLFSKITTR
jgi:hypothetical protein